MSRAALRLRRLAAVVALGAGAALSAPAAPASAAACEEGGGVTVVVDFASTGGGVQTACAPGDPTSGLEALRGAGFTPSRAAQQAGYFVCRIDGKPASDPCQRASPSDAYWSYWSAEPGGSWSFSSAGAADRDPAPGTVEGWAFGAGDPPSSPPPAERPAPAPAPPASSAAAPAPAPPPSAAGRPSAPAAPAPAGSATTPPAPAPAPSSAAPLASAAPSTAAGTSPSATPTPSRSAAPSRSPVAADVGTSNGEGGGSGGALVALTLVGLLAAAGGWQAWSRRRVREGNPA